MIQELRNIIYNTVSDATRKMTSAEIERTVVRATGVDRETARRAIKDLVSQGELTYTYVFGTSFLEKSFDRPVRISRRIVIKPHGKLYEPRPGDVVVNIGGGAAFGNGAHPSTCLALRALDSVLGSDSRMGLRAPLSGLDLGTGTGILAIALAKLGVQKVVGLDLDPCAISEAAHNVRWNDVAEHVSILSRPIEELTSCFTLIVANLAYPTLHGLSALLSQKTEQGGVLILSGFKMTASEDLNKIYTEHGFSMLQEETDHEWLCFVFQK